MIADADDEAALRARLADDPWTPAGMVRIAALERWTTLLGLLP